MPELPEVETTVRGLARFLEGQRMARVSVNRPDLRRPFPPDLAQALTGATVTALGRRAKYGLIHTDRERTMVFHLGMSGRWRIEPDTADRHDHLVLETGAGHVLAGIAASLEAQGAGLVGLATNTMHICAPQIVAALTVPRQRSPRS